MSMDTETNRQFSARATNGRRSGDRRSGQRGAVILLTTLCMLMVIPLAGIAIDAGVGYIVKTRLSVAVDAACLAGARSLHRGTSLTEQRAYAETVASRYFYANFKTGEWYTTGPNPVVNITEGAYRERIVTVTAVRTTPLYFMRMLGHTTVDVSITGQARRRDSNIILVLDRSSSMNTTSSVAPMKRAAKKFVDRFANGRDRLGLVTFKGSVDSTMAPTLNFKSQSPSLPTLIDQIVASGSTGSTAALNTAYGMLQTINEPGALNVIVFFTDGLPNGIVANWKGALIKSTSTCANPNNDRIGFIAQGGGGVNYEEPNESNTKTNGINRWQVSSHTSTGESQLASPALSGCYMEGASKYMFKDVERIPDVDYFGNRTFGFTGAVPGVDLTRLRNPWHIKYISMNTAIDQAARIRADANLRPIIYVIALGDDAASEPPDPVFLNKVANTRESATYDSNQESGQMILVQVSDQEEKLEEAFQQIAVEIIRLSL